MRKYDEGIGFCPFDTILHFLLLDGAFAFTDSQQIDDLYFKILPLLKAITPILRVGAVNLEKTLLA